MAVLRIAHRGGKEGDKARQDSDSDWCDNSQCSEECPDVDIF